MYAGRTNTHTQKQSRKHAKHTLCSSCIRQVQRRSPKVHDNQFRRSRFLWKTNIRNGASGRGRKRERVVSGSSGAEKTTVVKDMKTLKAREHHLQNPDYLVVLLLLCPRVRRDTFEGVPAASGQ